VTYVVNIALFYLGEMRDILSETEVGMKCEIELFSVTVVIPPPFCHLLIVTCISHRSLSIDG
jgi:hypothetical protein